MEDLSQNISQGGGEKNVVYQNGQCKMIKKMMFWVLAAWQWMKKGQHLKYQLCYGGKLTLISLLCKWNSSVSLLANTAAQFL